LKTDIFGLGQRYAANAYRITILAMNQYLTKANYTQKSGTMREAVIQIINLVDTLKEEVKFDD